MRDGGTPSLSHSSIMSVWIFVSHMTTCDVVKVYPLTASSRSDPLCKKCYTIVLLCKGSLTGIQWVEKTLFCEASTIMISSRECYNLHKK